MLDLCAGTGCLGLGVKRFCPAAQVTCLEKSPEAYRYLENTRLALKGQPPKMCWMLRPLVFDWGFRTPRCGAGGGDSLPIGRPCRKGNSTSLCRIRLT